VLRPASAPTRPAEIPLPDFYIGAHAAVAGLVLLTRDATRYRTYFPGVEIISP
jgi:predicted nucleic acid-binding protein